MRSLGSKTLVTVGVAAGLVGATLVGASGASAAAQHRGINTYRITKHANISGPAHLHPGEAEFRLTGAKSENLQLVRAHSGKGKQTLINDVKQLNQGKPKNLEDDFDLRGGGRVGEMMWTRLSSGTYYFVDTNSEVPTKSTIKTVTVSGAIRNVASPVATTITAVGEMTWAKFPKHMAGTGKVRLSNESKDWHFMELTRLRKGKTIADAKKALRGKESFAKVFYTSGARNEFYNGVVGPNRREVSTYSLNPGRYAVMCFWPDRAGNGMYHAQMGMIRELTVD